MSSSEPSYRFWCSTKSRVQSLNSISINTATKVLYVSTSSPVESCKFAYNLVPLSVLQLHCITFSCRLKGECVCIGIQFDGFRILIFYIEWNQLCSQFHCTKLQCTDGVQTVSILFYFKIRIWILQYKK